MLALFTFSVSYSEAQSNVTDGDSLKIPSNDSLTLGGITQKKDTIPADTLPLTGWVKPFDEGPIRLYRAGQMTFFGTIGNGTIVDGKEYIYNKEGELIRIKIYKDRKYLCDAPLPKAQDK